MADMLEGDPETGLVRKLLFNSLAVLDRSPLHRRMRAKPFGYTDDYLLIDWIYAGRIGNDSVGRHWDAFFRRYPGAHTGVRTRELMRSLSVVNMALPSIGSMYRSETWWRHFSTKRFLSWAHFWAHSVVLCAAFC